ncbi:MAG: hypothetical protein KDE09_02790 [Anaerolineales bacterium]|nr:hypothetical protein [Anaerolineales bacterium]
MMVLVSFVLTVAIYSYLVGDNPLYRLALHVLIGLSGAYAAVLAVQTVLLPPTLNLIQDPAGQVTWIIPLVLALLLLLKLVPRLAWLGNSTLATMVGIGAAVALTGAIGGTLWPQIFSAGGSNPILAIVAALLTACTVLSFQFSTLSGSTEPAVWLQPIRAIGRTVLTITFGALFATALATSITLLAERLAYFANNFSDSITAILP